MTRWEYQVRQARPKDAQLALDETGQEGWECFQVVAHERGVDLWLKRPLPEAPRRGLSGLRAAAAYDGREPL